MFSNNNICSYCVRNLSPIHYKCSVCPSILLCYFVSRLSYTQCFIHGVESGKHNKTHGYKIIQKKKPESSFNSRLTGWNLQNELNFLNEVERYGVGNWEDVSKRIQIKSADECREHFEKYFLTGLFSPEEKQNDHRKVVFDDSFELHSKKSDSIIVPSLLSSEEECLLGFMKLREDFEREYDNDAESLLTRIMSSSSTEQQTENEVQLKIAHIDIYNNRLRERFKRKNIGIQHGLITHILNGILGKKCKRRAITITNLADSVTQKTQTVSINLSFNAMRSKRTSSVNKKYTHRRQISRPLTPIDLAKKNNPKSNLGPFFEQLSNYDCFHINPKLKNFIRFLNPLQSFQFLNNLHREEILSSEITLLIDLNMKGIKSLTNKKPRKSLVKSEIFVYPAYRECDMKREQRSKNNSISDAEQIVESDPNHENEVEIRGVTISRLGSETSSSCSERKRKKSKGGPCQPPRKKGRPSIGNASILSFYKRKNEVENSPVESEEITMQTRHRKLRRTSRGS